MPGLPDIAVAMWGLDAASIGVAGPPGGEHVRGVIAWLAKAAVPGVRGVRIDATMSGIRPRELDRSGRRDLASLLRRNELRFGGVDVFVPPEHLVKADTVDRAMSSILGAIDLAADLAGLASGSVAARTPASGGGAGVAATISLALSDKATPDVVRSIADHAEGRGVRIANHAWPIVEKGNAEPAIGIGLDAAVALAAGSDPVMLAARLGARVVSVRIGDVGATGERAPPGRGRLDVPALLATLASTGHAGSAVLDLRGLKAPAEVIALVGRQATGQS
jgi:sugar phosphate isomerase/epimerase